MLVAAGLLLGLILWLDDKALTLEYLQALVWPLLLAGGLVWLRHPLRDKVGSLLQADVAGASLRFSEQQVTRELELDLAAPSAVLTAEEEDGDTGKGEDRKDPPESARGTGSGSQVDKPGEPAAIPPLRVHDAEEADLDRPTGGLARREAERRAAVETVIRESAAWGFDMAKLGFTDRPVPVIEWQSGEPKIRYASTRPSAPRADALRARLSLGERRAAAIEQLQDEVAAHERTVKQLERERHAALAGRNLDLLAAVDEQLQRQRAHLRALAPNSPWAKS